MKYLWAIPITVYCAPLLAAIFDVLCWFFIGHAVIVAWDENRIALMFVAYLFAPAAILMLLAAWNA